MPCICAGCGSPVDPIKAVFTVSGETGKSASWHWRCYHVEVDTKVCADGSVRQMTFEEWRQHQDWADRHHDGCGNHK